MADVEERVHALENEMTTLRISDAERRVVLAHLLSEVDGLSKAIKALTEAINKGKGALWVIGGLGIGIGSAVHWILDLIAGRH
jgi:hypothetical protein